MNMLGTQEPDLLHQSFIAEAGAAIGVREETWQPRFPFLPQGLNLLGR